MSFELVCGHCGARHDSTSYRLYCGRCGGLLEIEYDTPAVIGQRVIEGVPGLARYLPMLPLGSPANFVTMGEGDTPSVRLPRLGAALGLDRLYGKLEINNPTGSFKDRGNAVQVSVLKDLGVTAVADVTIGNAGHSFAGYCARAGIHCVGFVAAGASDQKTLATAYLGAELRPVEGDRRARADAARRYCDETGVLFMNYGENSYFLEGQKTMAYEISDQIDPLPDHILAPAGNGSIILGLWRGFREMLGDGRVARMPRLYAVQTQETQPIVAAFEDRPWTPARGSPASLAVGIGIAHPPRLSAVVQACRQSGGRAVAVAEGDILRWQKRLAESEGLLVEPTAAVSFAAAWALVQAGVIEATEPVLVPLTGSGFKEPLLRL